MWYGLLFTTHSPVVLTVWAETTPDVYQASGYGDLASGDKSIWFVLYLAGFLFLLSVFPRQVLVLCRS